jgi:hypothetical protein
MATRTLKIRRAAKISTGNYENTDVAIELDMFFDDITSSKAVFDALSTEVDNLLKEAIDKIELGAINAKSKANRFGV